MQRWRVQYDRRVRQRWPGWWRDGTIECGGTDENGGASEGSCAGECDDSHGEYGEMGKNGTDGCASSGSHVERRMLPKGSTRRLVS
ncbi:hypothetical protein PC128_g24781 [Phytophthora cactorum]|nr:hypothetical protein PC120_g22000 [Phytophthora cactorum]KAG3042999.1 hypothetical protein PC121_g22824 [Phytophthora cactorum]KAG3142423.1 hypothetical protein PC128_g24781 [Phytophthora cactorum]